MVFDPKAEPCLGCGREPDECICTDIPDEEELTDEFGEDPLTNDEECHDFLFDMGDRE